MLAKRNQETEKLLEVENSPAKTVESNGYAYNKMDVGDDVKAKLLTVHDVESESLSSACEDELTFNNSQLSFTDDSPEHLAGHKISSNNNEVVAVGLADTAVDVNDFRMSETTFIQVAPIYPDLSVTSEFSAQSNAVIDDSRHPSFPLSAMDGTQRNSSDFPEVSDTAETSFSEGQIPVDNEEKHLLQASNDETVEEQDVEDADYDGDRDSNASNEFFGSLRIDIQEFPWTSDLHRVVDIQLGEQEWDTNVSTIEGGVRIEGWKTKISNIGKSQENLEDWNTAIHELPVGQELHERWNTTIAENFRNQEVAIDWSTAFHGIEKNDDRKSKWTTVFRKIDDHDATKEEWKSTFNAIGKRIAKNNWKFKLPTTLSNPSKITDWRTTFTKLEGVGGSGAADPWENKFNEILLKSDDRKSHWNSKFLDIGATISELNPWTTAFREISKEDGEDTWNTTFLAISDEKNVREDWATKFIDIEKHVPDENEWLINRQDVPNDYKEAADWATLFLSIENHQANKIWDTSFNEIIPKSEHHETEIWETSFLQADMEDIERKDWEMHCNGILPNELDALEWQVFDNKIERADGGGDEDDDE